MTLLARLQRPPHPDFELPEGAEWRVVDDDGWRLATPAEAEERVCRHSTRHPCPNAPVAALGRRRRRYLEPMDLDGRIVWWLYCADHMYGRWVEGDRVLAWVVRRVDETVTA